MGQIVIQIYRCIICSRVYEVQSFGVFMPSCPFCGKGAPLYLGEKRIET